MVIGGLYCIITDWDNEETMQSNSYGKALNSHLSVDMTKEN